MPSTNRQPSRTKDGYVYDASGSSYQGLWTDAVVPSSSRTRASYDVIVIGAGFAGLVAARDLALDSNLRVLLLEARDRIGGRTWTAKAWGEEFEMGGTYVHWSQPHVYAELHRQGLEKNLKTSMGSIAMEQALFKPPGGDLQRIDDVKSYNAKMAEVAEQVFSIDGMSPRKVMPYPHEPSRSQPWTNYDGMSVQDRLDQLGVPKNDKDLFAALTNSCGSASAKEIAYTDAMRWYAAGGYSVPTMMDAAASFKIGKGGMTSLARSILGEYAGDTVLQKTVTRVRQAEPSRVSIDCAGGSVYQARRVICTIPLNCLADIQFEPPLSALKRSAVKEGHINVGEKYHFFVDQIQKNWFTNTSDVQGSDFVFGLKDHEGTERPRGTFSMFFGHNGRLTNPSDSDRVISEYRKLQPNGNVKGYLSHTWSNDPYAKGAWFCAAPGFVTKYLEALQQSHGGIFMASADWANGWRGFVDGAIEQGGRAAAMVRAALKQEYVGMTARL